MTMTTDIPLGFANNYDSLLQRFDHDESIPHLVSKEFDDIAAEHGIVASLRFGSSLVYVSVDELGELPDDDDECLHEWLREAVERVAERWMNHEI